MQFLPVALAANLSIRSQQSMIQKCQIALLEQQQCWRKVFNANSYTKSLIYLVLCSEDVLLTPAQRQMAVTGDTNFKVGPGDTLQFRDNNNITHTVYIKDQGSTVMRGCFFIVTTILDHEGDDGREDREVSAEEMAAWVLRRVDRQ